MDSFLIEIFIWVILLPLTYIICTPFIAFRALIKRGIFIQECKKDYIEIYQWWKKLFLVS